jgi:hypothetical protein
LPDTFLSWLQTTPVATTIGGSLLLTGFLSAIHLVGLTLLVGAVLVMSLRMLGVILTDHPLGDIARAPERGMMLGLTISVLTGLLLFSARAPTIAASQFFQLKMLLLGFAIAFHFTVYRAVIRQPGTALPKIAGALGFLLWFGVAAAGCAFILLE